MMNIRIVNNDDTTELYVDVMASFVKNSAELNAGIMIALSIARKFRVQIVIEVGDSHPAKAFDLKPTTLLQVYRDRPEKAFNLNPALLGVHGIMDERGGPWDGNNEVTIIRNIEVSHDHDQIDYYLGNLRLIW